MTHSLTTTGHPSGHRDARASWTPPGTSAPAGARRQAVFGRAGASRNNQDRCSRRTDDDGHDLRYRHDAEIGINRRAAISSVRRRSTRDPDLVRAAYQHSASGCTATPHFDALLRQQARSNLGWLPGKGSLRPIRRIILADGPQIRCQTSISSLISRSGGGAQAKHRTQAGGHQTTLVPPRMSYSPLRANSKLTGFS